MNHIESNKYPPKVTTLTSYYLYMMPVVHFLLATFLTKFLAVRTTGK